MNKRYKIISNRIRCAFCGDYLESRTRHDFKTCRCGRCSVDGGLDYLKRSFPTEKPEQAYQELSVVRDMLVGKNLDISELPDDYETAVLPDPDIPDARKVLTDVLLEKSDATPTEVMDEVDKRLGLDTDISEKPEAPAAEEEKTLPEEQVHKKVYDKDKPTSGRYPWGKK